MWWKQQIQGETILYAALDVFAKCLGSKFLGEARPKGTQVDKEDPTEGRKTAVACEDLLGAGEHVGWTARDHTKQVVRRRSWRFWEERA